MIQGKTFLLAGLGAAALVAAAERSGAQDGAAGVPGTYTLAQVESRPLPAVVETDGACRDELVSGTLTLADGAWTLETVERELCEGRAPVEDRESDRGRYTVSGQTVTFAADASDVDDADDTSDADDLDDADDVRDADDPDDAAAQRASSGTDVDVEEPASGTVDGATLTVRLRAGQTVVFRR
jgi:hypothetical protein